MKTRISLMVVVLLPIVDIAPVRGWIDGAQPTPADGNTVWRATSAVRVTSTGG